VAAVSTSDVWAVGGFSDPNTDHFLTLTEHWDGTSWQIVSSPNSGTTSAFNGVAAAAASKVVAAGGGGPSQTLVERWNGTSWQIMPTPNVDGNGELAAVARVPGAAQAWAVGDFFNNNGQEDTLTEFYCG